MLNYKNKVRQKLFSEYRGIFIKENTENNEIKAADISVNSWRKNDQAIFNTQKTLREHTIDIIRQYLKNNGNDVLATAKMLDIGKSTIYKMIQDREVSI